MGVTDSEKDCDGLHFSLSLRYSALFVVYNPPLISRGINVLSILLSLAALCNKCTYYRSSIYCTV